MKWAVRVRDAKGVRADFDEQVCLIGYFGKRGRGRPPMTVLGPGVKRQIDRDVGVEIVGALMAEYKLKGIEVEMPLGAKLREETGKQLWVGQQLVRLTRFNPHVSDENPVEAFRKAAGDLLPIGKKGRMIVSITTAGADDMFTHNFKDMGLAKGAAAARLNDLRLKLTERYLAVVGGTGKTVEDAYAEYCERFKLPRAANE